MNRFLAIATLLSLPVTALAQQYRAPTSGIAVMKAADRARMQGDSRGPTTTVRTATGSTTTYQSGAKMATTYINNNGQTGVRSVYTGPSGLVINSSGTVTTKTPTGSVTRTW